MAQINYRDNIKNNINANIQSKVGLTQLWHKRYKDGLHVCLVGLVSRFCGKWLEICLGY